jgi:hypothetical protein
MFALVGLEIAFHLLGWRAGYAAVHGLFIGLILSVVIGRWLDPELREVHAALRAKGNMTASERLESRIAEERARLHATREDPGGAPKSL